MANKSFEESSSAISFNNLSPESSTESQRNLTEGDAER
jgi:hypothetical protein